MKRYNLFLPIAVLTALRSLAERKHTTTSELIRRILVEYMEKA